MEIKPDIFHRTVFRRMESMKCGVPKKPPVKINALWIVPAVFLLLATAAHALTPTVHFTGVETTPSNCFYFGGLTILGEPAAFLEDEVGVFVDDGAGGRLLVGACVFGDSNQQDKYLIAVNGDDPLEPGKNGAGHHDVLTFKVWDKSEDKEYTIGTADFSVEYRQGLNEPAIPPVYQTDVFFGLLNLSAVPPPGDIDQNSEVELADAILALKIVTGVQETGSLDADVNDDDRIGIHEAIYILQYLSGLF